MNKTNVKKLLSSALSRINHATIIDDFTKQVIITFNHEAYSVIFYEDIDNIINCTKSAQINKIANISVIPNVNDAIEFEDED